MYRLRVVQTQVIWFLSEKDGSDIKRDWFLITSYSVDRDMAYHSQFTVVVCRIRLFSTMCQKWTGSGQPLILPFLIMSRSYSFFVFESVIWTRQFNKVGYGSKLCTLSKIRIQPYNPISVNKIPVLWRAWRLLPAFFQPRFDSVCRFLSRTRVEFK